MNIFENEAICAVDDIAIAIETNYNPYLTVWWYYPWYRIVVASACDVHTMFWLIVDKQQILFIFLFLFFLLFFAYKCAKALVSVCNPLIF